MSDTLPGDHFADSLFYSFQDSSKSFYYDREDCFHSGGGHPIERRPKPKGRPHVHVVSPEDGWALQQIADAVAGDNITRGTTPRLDADINFYVHYLMFDKCGSNKSNFDIGYFTHAEPGEHGERFDRIASQMDYCVAISRLTARRLPAHKTKVVLPPVSANLRRTQLRLGICARDYPRKRLQWVGKIRDLGFDVILSNGEISAENLPMWFESIDYLLVTSSIEGGPLPVLEALAFGKPVIAPDVGFCWDFPVVRYDGTFMGLEEVLTRLRSASRTHEQFNTELREVFSIATSPAVKTSQVVVYTALFGDYDCLRCPTVVNPEVRYVCFTDQPHKCCPPWEPIIVENSATAVPNGPSLLNRHVKILPQNRLPEYEWWIYMDANCQLRSDPVRLLYDLERLYCPGADIYVCQQKGVHCAYEEAERVKRYRFSPDSIVDSQVAFYRQEGLPEARGVANNRFLVRRNNERTGNFSRLWWQQVNQFSHRDQISFPYVAWKLPEVKVHVLSWDVQGKFVRVFPHQKPHQLF